VNIALREGDLNAGLLEGVVDGIMQTVSRDEKVINVLDERTKFKIERAVAEFQEERLRLGLIQH